VVAPDLWRGIHTIKKSPIGVRADIPPAHTR